MHPLSRLTDHDRPLIARHLKRLSGQDRQRRFGSPLKDPALDSYARKLDLQQGRCLGYIEAGELRGLAEIFPEGRGATTCEAAFTVDADWRGQGLGTHLMDRVLRLTAAEGYRRVVLYIQQANTPMRLVARKHGFALALDMDGYVATREIEPAAPLALLAELAETAQGGFLRVVDAAAGPRQAA